MFSCVQFWCKHQSLVVPDALTVWTLNAITQLLLQKRFTDSSLFLMSTISASKRVVRHIVHGRVVLVFYYKSQKRKKERKDVKSAMTVSDHSVFIFIPLCTWPDTLRCTEFCCCGPSSAWAACCGSRSRSWHSQPWTSCLLYGNGWSRRHCRACGRHRSGSPHVCSAGRMTKEKCVISKNEPFNYRGSVLKACVYYLMLFIGQFSRFENVGHIKKKRQYFPLKSTKL